jgi:hypothetical protein
MGSEDHFESREEMPFDLRHTYAIGILTPILLSIELCRENNKFPEWFDKLTMSLHTNIHQKLLEDERKEYNIKLNETIKVLNDHPDTFQGRDKDPRKIFIVKRALKDLEMWLKDRMQEHGLFGSGWSDDEESL